jgi:hypothetical protein
MGDAEPSSESGLEDQVKDRHILYVSAGANHTVALLCMYKVPPFSLSLSLSLNF